MHSISDGAQSPRLSSEDEVDDVKEQCVRAILQTLQCFKLPLTPLDIVLEIISTEGKYARVKNDMLNLRSITKFLDALAACEAGRDALQRALDYRALSVALRHVDHETKSIVARIGNHSHHPILLGHAEIRSGPTPAPFLKAILDQVNASMTAAHQAPVNDEVEQEDYSDESVKSDVSVEDTVEAMLFLGNSMHSPTPEVTRQESTTAGDTEVSIGQQGVPESVVEEEAVCGSAIDTPSAEAIVVTQSTKLQTPIEYIIEMNERAEVENTDGSPTETLYSERTGLAQYSERLIGGTDTASPYAAFTTYSSQKETASASSEPTAAEAVEDKQGEGAAMINRDDEPLADNDPREIIAPVDVPEAPEDDTGINHPPETAPTEDSPRRRRHAAEKASPAKVRTKGRVGPYECTLCDARFKMKKSLQDHMNTHTGAKPYKCDHPGCDQHFSHYVTLRAHRQTFHKILTKKRKLKRSKKEVQSTSAPRPALAKSDELLDEDTEPVENVSGSPIKTLGVTTSDEKHPDLTSAKEEAIKSVGRTSRKNKVEEQSAPSRDVAGIRKVSDSDDPSSSTFKKQTLKIKLPRNTRNLALVPEMAVINNLPLKRKRLSSEKKAIPEGKTSTSGKARTYSCRLCPRTFTTYQCQKDHMNTHTGAKPYVCIHPSCGQRFTHYSTYWHHSKKSH